MSEADASEPSPPDANLDERQYAVFYDFDCTLSSHHVYANTGGSVEEDFKKNYGKENVEHWFGGQSRLDRLTEHFRKLEALGVKLHICSFGFVGVIRECLRLLELDTFIQSYTGRDSIELHNVSFEKAEFIRKWMAEEMLPYDNVVFLDDDRSNVDLVKQRGICRYSYVPQTGMTSDIMDALESYFFGLMNPINDSKVSAEVLASASEVILGARNPESEKPAVT